jgi:hypothetical protein
MPQAVLLSNITNAGSATPIKLKAPISAATIQFTPSGGGFSGTICIQFSVAANTAASYLWYSIPTIGIDPWSEPVTLVFNGQTSAVVFNLLLGAGNVWVRSAVTEYRRGSISGYLAY